MNILIDIGHPGHVHLFRNAYHELTKKGHLVLVTVREIPIAKKLLEFYKIPYVNIGEKKDTLFGKALSVIKQDIAVLKLVKENNIELGLSSGIVLSHVSLFTKLKAIIFDDDDDCMEPLMVKYAHPFSDTVLSPSSIKRKTNKNIAYDGTHELAYLHPNKFIPDISVIERIDIAKNEVFFVLRFVALQGHHDGGHKGLSLVQKRELINLLRTKGKVFITSEKPIETEFEQYRLPVPPEDIHSLLYYATIFLGDSQTMTSEAAILGTPALKCNTFAGKLSIPNLLETKYGLCYSYLPIEFNQFIDKAKELIDTPNLKEKWEHKRLKFIADKIDVTAFMVWFIENYPESKCILKENPNYQYKFCKRNENSYSNRRSATDN